jgi:hypothetical protein
MFMNVTRRGVGAVGAGVALLLVGAFGRAQDLPLGAQVPVEGGARVARAVRVERAPRMDGTLNDPIWQQAAPITEFRQREPFEGQRATESTEVRVR